MRSRLTPEEYDKARYMGMVARDVYFNHYGRVPEADKEYREGKYSFDKHYTEYVLQDIVDNLDKPYASEEDNLIASIFGV